MASKSTLLRIDHDKAIPRIEQHTGLTLADSQKVAVGTAFYGRSFAGLGLFRV
jgi:hypothetical protein